MIKDIVWCGASGNMSTRRQSLRSAQNVKNSSTKTPSKTEKSKLMQLNDTMETTDEHTEPEIKEMFTKIMGKLAKLDEIDHQIDRQKYRKRFKRYEEINRICPW